jgi:hypothetical protein
VSISVDIGVSVAVAVDSPPPDPPEPLWFDEQPASPPTTATPPSVRSTSLRDLSVISSVEKEDDGKKRVFPNSTHLPPVFRDGGVHG